MVPAARGGVGSAGADVARCVANKWIFIYFIFLALKHRTLVCVDQVHSPGRKYLTNVVRAPGAHARVRVRINRNAVQPNGPEWNRTERNGTDTIRSDRDIDAAR